MTPRKVLRSALPVAIVAATFLAACGDDSGSSDSPETTATPVATTAAPATTIAAVTIPAVLDPLDGTMWVLDSAALGVAGGEAVVSTIGFASGMASGSAGCNNFNVSYQVEGDGLTFGAPISTKIACPDPQAAVETAVFAAFGNVAGFTVTADALTLTDASGTALLTYAPAPTTVEGNWIATGYLKSDASAFTSVILDTELTASFLPDLTVAGTSGCNNFTGGYAPGLDNAITIGPLASTLMACETPEGVMAQETDYLLAMQSAVSFTNTGATLTLFNAAGQQVVTFNTFSAG